MFKDYFIQSKEGMLTLLRNSITSIDEKASTDKVHSAAFYQSLKTQLDLFIDFLDTFSIPKLPEPFCYKVEVRCDKIVLLMQSISDDLKIIPEINKKIYSILDEYTLIKLPFNLLSVEEYGKLYNVSGYVITQWIRRGKLKSAKRMGREWYVSEIDEPYNKFKETTYEWIKKGNEKIFVDDYEYLNKYNKLIINQSKDSKMKYEISMYDDMTGNTDTSILTNLEKEKLEVELLSNSKVENKNNLILVIG